MLTVPVDGSVVAYLQVGAGPPCLVLPGWPGLDHVYLRPGLDALGARVGLVYVDHRGTGGSGPVGDPCSMEQLADDAMAVAAAVAGHEPVLLLGHHLGVAVALEAALRHPGQVAGLVLVAGTPGQLGAGESLADSFDVEPTPPEVEVLQRVPPASDEELAATMQTLSPFFTGRSGPPPPEGLFAACSFSAEAAARTMMASGWWSAVDRLGSLDLPALAVVGRRDVVYPPHESERITRHLKDSRLVVLEESGHLPWLDEPEAFVRAVTEWLDGAGGR